MTRTQIRNETADFSVGAIPQLAISPEPCLVWKDELETPSTSPQSPPYTPIAPSQPLLPPLATPTSPNTQPATSPTQMNSPTKRTAPFKSTATPESHQKRMKAISDAMDIDTISSPPHSPTRPPIRPGINFANIPNLNTNARAGPSTSRKDSPITPSKSSASEARLAAIRQALTPQSPSVSNPVSARSHTNAPLNPPTVTQNGGRYNLSELGIDLSTPRPTVSQPRDVVPPANSDSEDELWASFTKHHPPPPESSQDEVASNLLSPPVDLSPVQPVVNGHGRDKGKQKASDDRKEDEFWMVRPTHQSKVFTFRRFEHRVQTLNHLINSAFSPLALLTLHPPLLKLYPPKKNSQGTRSSNSSKP